LLLSANQNRKFFSRPLGNHSVPWELSKFYVKKEGLWKTNQKIVCAETAPSPGAPTVSKITITFIVPNVTDTLRAKPKEGQRQFGMLP
jgi:hypothetical protein